MTRMNYLSNVYRTVQYMRGLTDERINTAMSTGQRILLGNLIKMGIRIGGING
jgi:hypothetical protein